MRADELGSLSEVTLKKLDEDEYAWNASCVGAWVKSSNRFELKYNNLIGEYNKLLDIHNKAKTGIYIIKCPKCKVEYEVHVRDFMYAQKINCMDCGHSYSQHNHIVGVKTFKEDFMMD